MYLVSRQQNEALWLGWETSHSHSLRINGIHIFVFSAHNLLETSIKFSSWILWEKILFRTVRLVMVLECRVRYLFNAEIHISPVCKWMATSAMILPNSSAFNFRIDFSSSSLIRLIIDSKSIFESSKLANKDFKKFRLKPKNANLWRQFTFQRFLGYRLCSSTWGGFTFLWTSYFFFRFELNVC